MTPDSHRSPAHGFPAWLVQATLDDALRCSRRPALLAISGLQGSGKSTLAAQVVAAAAARGLHAATLSLDDVYLTRAARAQRAQRVHPLLATRGPPGTHDLTLALDCLDALTAGRPTRLPRFDKLADERLPVAAWPQVERPLDLLVMEGWCLGAQAEATSALIEPINTLERDCDPDGRWRRYVNAALARDYPPLWQRFDRLWLLLPPAFEVIPRWRWEQEQALQATRPGHAGMDRAGIERFVQHYERVSRHLLRTLPARADRTVVLDERRRPRALRARPHEC